MPVKHYVLTKSAARQGLAELRKLKVHRTFAGYLCLRETARATGKRVNLKPDFAGFFDRYLKVGGSLSKAPYVVPFNDKGSALWFNRNVAGSYAPSSLRDVSPLRQVADIFGSRADHTFSLKDEDAKLCVTNLLHGQQVPVLPLAAFLLRDYAFVPDENQAAPTHSDLTAAFRDRFGFRDSESSENADFSLLFSTAQLADSVTFEELPQ